MAMITLTQGKSAYFDELDTGVIANHKWWAVRFGKNWYAATKINGNRIFMHRLLMNLNFKESIIVDHIDGNGLNNSKTNLRLANHTLNMRNRRVRHDNLCGISGVTFRATHGCSGAWTARGMKDGKLISKNFGCHRRGYDEAFRMACEWRNLHEKENNITTIK